MTRPEFKAAVRALEAHETPRDWPVSCNGRDHRTSTHGACDCFLERLEKLEALAMAAIEARDYLIRLEGAVALMVDGNAERAKLTKRIDALGVLP